jgi:transcriptional regulator with XRE-family HTH domain
MNSKKFNESFGKILRDHRLSNDLTQGELASLASLSRGTIANLETGRQAASAHQVYILANCLNLKSVDHLYPLFSSGEEHDDDDIEIKFASGASDLSDAQRSQVRALARAAG